MTVSKSPISMRLFPENADFDKQERFHFSRRKRKSTYCKTGVTIAKIWKLVNPPALTLFYGLLTSDFYLFRLLKNNLDIKNCTFYRQSKTTWETSSNKKTRTFYENGTNSLVEELEIFVKKTMQTLYLNNKRFLYLKLWF